MRDGCYYYTLEEIAGSLEIEDSRMIKCFSRKVEIINILMARLPLFELACL